MIEQHLIAFIPVLHLWKIKEAVVSILTEVFGFEYRGYLGVDMLIYRHNNTFAVHPLMEINVRNTMGLVALQLSNRLVHPSSCGQLAITCEKAQNQAYNAHLQMTEKFPLQVSGAKIRSGYLSLCPVTAETRFRAYVLIV
jgi:predicted ATP-grasp superfamily ATP-dependent carboligase